MKNRRHEYFDDGCKCSGCAAADGVLCRHDIGRLPGRMAMRGPEGEQGEPGISPEIITEKIEGGERVTVKDAFSVRSFEIMDGADGVDGFSPEVDVWDIPGGKRISVTDKLGTKLINIMHGEKGEKGENGVDGRDGIDGKDGANVVGIILERTDFDTEIIGASVTKI